MPVKLSPQVPETTQPLHSIIPSFIKTSFLDKMGVINVNHKSTHEVFFHKTTLCNEIQNKHVNWCIGSNYFALNVLMPCHEESWDKVQPNNSGLNILWLHQNGASVQENMTLSLVLVRSQLCQLRLGLWSATRRPPPHPTETIQHWWEVLVVKQFKVTILAPGLA